MYFGKRSTKCIIEAFAVKIAVDVCFYSYLVCVKQDLEGVDGAIVEDVRSVLGSDAGLSPLVKLGLLLHSFARSTDTLNSRSVNAMELIFIVPSVLQL
jgi:hypothetical protein